MNYAGQPISVEKIRQSDMQELERLFRSCYKQLCVYAENITGDALQAEDIVSNLFVKLWEKREQLQIHTAIESYLMSAVHNEALNYLKHAEVEKRYHAKTEYQLTHADLLNPSAAADTPLNDLLEKELKEQIETALRTLPPQCREIFTLHKIDDLSYQEVADQLNISINTVRTQLTRAMKKMRSALKGFMSSGSGKTNG
jgi:RNA polymerase sigma-70 factor (ECF subfamily)